ncbi:MAG: pyridoxamine 5'-phosphate oxidase [Gemmatimonadota bacterium]|nr:pyridoxamine 5'-phosphate oxidase [Gemmatimonadota bacterium]
MDPIEEFRALFAQAQAVDRLRLPDPTAMSLATVSTDGWPSVRIVLLKSVDERGFVFYTNLNGRKGRELLSTSRAALCFYWAALDTQIRVEGTVEPVTDAEADAYFASRARESQIGAWASRQSETLSSMDALRGRVLEVEQLYENKAVPRPPYWTGRRVKPARIEFWHAGDFRLHERRLFERDGDRWTMRRLFP